MSLLVHLMRSLVSRYELGHLLVPSFFFFLFLLAFRVSCRLALHKRNTRLYFSVFAAKSQHKYLAIDYRIWQLDHEYHAAVLESHVLAPLKKQPHG